MKLSPFVGEWLLSCAPIEICVPIACIVRLQPCDITQLQHAAGSSIPNKPLDTTAKCKQLNCVIPKLKGDHYVNVTFRLEPIGFFILMKTNFQL